MRYRQSIFSLVLTGFAAATAMSSASSSARADDAALAFSFERSAAHGYTRVAVGFGDEHFGGYLSVSRDRHGYVRPHRRIRIEHRPHRVYREEVYYEYDGYGGYGYEHRYDRYDRSHDRRIYRERKHRDKHYKKHYKKYDKKHRKKYDKKRKHRRERRHHD